MVMDDLGYTMLDEAVLWCYGDSKRRSGLEAYGTGERTGQRLRRCPRDREAFSALRKTACALGHCTAPRGWFSLACGYASKQRSAATRKNVPLPSAVSTHFLARLFKEGSAFPWTSQNVMPAAGR